MKEKLLHLIEQYTEIPGSCKEFVADFWLHRDHPRNSKFAYCPKIFNTMLYLIATGHFTPEEVRVVDVLLKKNLGRSVPTDQVSVRRVGRLLEFSEKIPAPVLGIAGVLSYPGVITTEPELMTPILDKLETAGLVKQRDKNGIQISRFVSTMFTYVPKAFSIALLRFELGDDRVDSDMLKQIIDDALSAKPVTITNQIVAGYYLKLMSMKSAGARKRYLTKDFQEELSMTFFVPTVPLLTKLGGVANLF